MKKYLLILVITHTLSQGGVTGFSAEFDSLESCNKALLDIKKDVRKAMFNDIISAGCYQK